MEANSIIHVAIADDHNLVRTGLISVLKSIPGIIVDMEAENGLVLLQKLETAQIQPDICIIDISMPVMDGYELLSEIRQRWPGMKTMILTAHSEELSVIRMMLAGANGYLLKKCTDDQMKDALYSINEDGYYFSECANSTLFHLIKTNSIKLQSFSESEIEFLKHCCSDLTYKEIAKKMNVTESSINGLRNRVSTKLNETGRVALALFAVRFGLVPVDVNYSGKSIISQSKIKTS